VTFGPVVDKHRYGVIEETPRLARLRRVGASGMKTRRCDVGGVTLAMPQINHVIVPVDGSPFAERTLDPAGLLAHRLHASRTVVTVVPGSAHAAPIGSTIATDVLIGDDAGVAIGEYAEHLNGSVVCMSTHGRGWPSSVFVGSAAAMVLARTETPIILIGPECQPGWRLDGTVVAGVDGQPGSELMLPMARAWASMLGMGLIVAAVVEPAPQPLRPEHAHRLYGPQGDADIYIDKLVASLKGTDVDVTGQVISDPVGPAIGLRSFLGHNADDADARGSKGLLAISSHGRKPTPGVPLGRTALHIVHQSPVPVLVIPLAAKDSRQT
jgi:nucleotide-binding universal stress UspA family protein